MRVLIRCLIYMLSGACAIAACTLSGALAVCDPEIGLGICGPAADGRMVVKLVLCICAAWILALLLATAGDLIVARSGTSAKEDS